MHWVEVSQIFWCVFMYISVSSLKQMFSAADGSKSHFQIQEDKGKTKVHRAWGEGWQSANLLKIDHSMESVEGVLFLKEVQRCLGICLVHYRGNMDCVRCSNSCSKSWNHRITSPKEPLDVI